MALVTDEQAGGIQRARAAGVRGGSVLITWLGQLLEDPGHRMRIARVLEVHGSGENPGASGESLVVECSAVSVIVVCKTKDVGAARGPSLDKTDPVPSLGAKAVAALEAHPVLRAGLRRWKQEGERETRRA
jgi:hypothetical protein